MLRKRRAAPLILSVRHMRKIILIIFLFSLLSGAYIEKTLGHYGIGLFQPKFPLGVKIDWMTTSSGRTPYFHAQKSLISISNGGSVLNNTGEILKINKVYSYLFAKEDNNLYIEVATNKQELHYVSFYKNTRGVTEAVAISEQLFEQKLQKSINEYKWVSLEKEESIDSILNVSRLANYVLLLLTGIMLVLLKRKGDVNA